MLSFISCFSTFYCLNFYQCTSFSKLKHKYTCDCSIVTAVLEYISTYILQRGVVANPCLSELGDVFTHYSIMFK